MPATVQSDVSAAAGNTVQKTCGGLGEALPTTDVLYVTRIQKVGGEGRSITIIWAHNRVSYS